MPPKRGSRGHGAGGGHYGGAGGSSRRNFSIATFFDAASSSLSGRRGGTGFRVGSGNPTLSQMASAFHDNHDSHHHLRGFGSRCNGNEEEEDDNGSEMDRGSSTGYSATLQEVRSRILAEVAEEQQATARGPGRRATGPSRLHQHRQRALLIAFGGTGEGGQDNNDGTNNGCSQGQPSPSSQQRFSNRGSGGGSRAGDEAEDELMVSSVEFSLLCPYSRLPMTHPVRSRDCRHVQCCDLESWMVLLDKCRSLRDPKGPCPVCEQRVAASSLEVDFWMMNVMAQMPPGTRLVELDADGSYRNGDLTRERRKEMITTEVIDATQEGDYENYLGDVVDDDSDGVTQQKRAAEVARQQLQQQQHPQQARYKRPRSPSVTAVASSQDTNHAGHETTAVPNCQTSPTTVKTEVFAHHQEQGLHAPIAQPAADPAHESGVDAENRDRVGDGGLTSPQLPLPSVEEPPLPSQDPGVVIVHYVAGTRHRALPSQVRLWLPYCPACQSPLLKGEDGLMEACRSCGQSTQKQWTLVRRFEESNAVSMELTPDDTLILRGVDVASAYLFRAGFQRNSFGPAPGGGSGGTGVWATSFPLTRIELDFLEACCQRIALGESIEDLASTVPVPSLFRIPRRRNTGGYGGTGGYRSYNATQQQHYPLNTSQARAFGGGGSGGGKGITSNNRSGVASGNPLEGLSQQQQQQRSQVSPYYPLFAAR